LKAYFLFILPLLLFSGCSGNKYGNPPNVLLLFTDQHNGNVLGCLNHPDVITPNLDKLTADGILFTHAYAQDAICVPSRTTLMTGMYPRTTGVLDNSDRSSVLDEVVSLASIFQENGYATYAVGKRHTFQNADEGWGVKYSHKAEKTADDYKLIH